jgi:hypothetical protein
MNMEVDESTVLEDITKHQQRHSRLRRISLCCSELQSVWISDSAVVTYSHDL